jgi:hypothetical protein
MRAIPMGRAGRRQQIADAMVCLRRRGLLLHGSILDVAGGR